MLSEKESEYVEDFKSCNDMYKEPYLSARKARVRAEEERDQYKGLYEEICSERQQLERERGNLKEELERVRNEGYHRSYDYDSSDATETPSKNLKWQDVVLIGVFTSTLFLMGAGFMGSL